MRKIILGAGAILLAVIALLAANRSTGTSTPPQMDENGVVHSSCLLAEWLCRRETVDYASVVREATSQRARFLTMTIDRDIVREQALEVRFAGIPSRGRVRVNYHVQYPIGYDLGDKLQVRGEGNNLILVLDRPSLVADVAVKLKDYKVLDSGYLVDENTAIIKMQQAIQPEAAAKTREILDRPGVIPTSEKALLGFLKPLVAKAAAGQAPPDIVIHYR